MKKADREELESLFESFVRLFQSRCWACHGKYNKTEAFTIHHREYRAGEMTYKDFRLVNGNPDKLAYYRYITPFIKRYPKTFRLLHHKHHYMAEYYARPRFFERLVKLSREINKRKYPR